MDQSELLNDRIFLSTITGDGACGGTDAGTYFRLLGNGGVRYPENGNYYDCDNSGDDMERGHRDDYWIETSSIRPVHTLQMYFSRSGNLPEWDFEVALVSRWKWQPELGIWYVAEVMNAWAIYDCIRETGFYTFSPAVDLLSEQHKEASRFAAARDMIRDKPELSHAIADLLRPRPRPATSVLQRVRASHKTRTTPAWLNEVDAKTIKTY